MLNPVTMRHFGGAAETILKAAFCLKFRVPSYPPLRTLSKFKKLMAIDEILVVPGMNASEVGYQSIR